MNNRLKLVVTSAFKKDLKRIKKRGLDLTNLKLVLERLLNQENLDIKYRDHALTGNYLGFIECHIEPDWLLIYYVDNNQLILTASRTGSHSDLF